MAQRIYAIALNTFREAIRNKVLYGILAVVVAANLFALVLGQMSLHQEARFARDVGLGGVSIFGSLTAIVLGVSLLYNEIRRKTIHNILSKPLERYEFVLGKYFGMAFTLAILVFLFSLALAGLLAIVSYMYVIEVPFTAAIFKAILLGYMEVLIVSAVALLFSSFSTPYLSGIFTCGIYLLGRVSEEMRLAAETAKQTWIRPIAEVALVSLPELHLFAISGGQVDGKHVSIHGDFVTWQYVGMASLNATMWIGLLLLLAAVAFSRRDLA